MARNRTREVMRRRPQATALRSTGFVVKTVLVVAICAVVVPLLAAGVAVGTLLFGRLPGRLPAQKPAFEARPSSVYDSAGNVIGVFRQFELTVPMRPEDVPQVLKDAVVAAEDRRFWSHRGVDLEGIARAAWANYEEGETVQGASTITQQYVRAAYLNNNVTLSRKLREAILATQLERRMTKQEILFNYLNTTYFGSGSYGANAAAVQYFGKGVNALTLSEAAMLAGVIPAPTVYSPRVDPVVAEERRKMVLGLMLEQELISQQQYDEAIVQALWFDGAGPPPGPATLIAVPPAKGASRYPYFVDWVEQVMLAKYGPEKLYRGGLRIESSIDPGMQALAEEAVRANLEGTEAPVDIALASVDPATGLVRAMVGGRDYMASQLNLAIGGSTGFQPGSSFKTFVLAAAFEAGIGPETVYDAPTRFRIPNCDGPDCYLGNYEGGGGGRRTLRQATAASTNTVFTQLIMDVGIQRTAEMAHRLGVTSIDPKGDYGVSLSLGAAEVSPLDMASAYGTIANQGVRQAPTPVARVVDGGGNIIEDNTARPGERAISANIAANLDDVLTGVITNGTGTAARLNRPAAGKTGTAEAYTSAWFVGYTPQLSTAVWMGHTDGFHSLPGSITGGSTPARTWAAFMRPATEAMPVVPFPPPAPLQAQVEPGFKPGTGDGGGVATVAADPAAPPDTTPKVGTAGTPLVTPDDCDGPCQSYDASSLVDLPPVTAPPTAPPGGAPPAAPAASPAASPTGQAAASATGTNSSDGT